MSGRVDTDAKSGPVPTPAERPTEWAVSVVAAVLGVISVFIDLPEGFESAFLALVALLAPAITMAVEMKVGKKN